MSLVGSSARMVAAAAAAGTLPMAAPPSLTKSLALRSAGLPQPVTTGRDTLEAAGPHERECAAAPALEIVGGGRPGDQGRRRAQQAAGRGAELQRIVTEHDENTGRRHREFGKSNGRAVGHDAVLLR